MKSPVIVSRAGRNRLASYALIAFLLGSVWGVAMWNYGGVYSPLQFPTAGSLKRFTSYDELWTFLNKSSTEVLGRGFYAMGIVKSPNLVTSSQVSGILDTLTAVNDFSGTNIQVEGVDEADVVKTDGKYIYVIANDSVIIVEAFPPEGAKIVSKITLNQTVSEMFVSRDKLALFLGTSQVYGIMPMGPIRWIPPYLTSTVIQVYDISDRATPKLERDITVDGNYFDSRMIGDYVYMITNQPAFVNKTEVNLPIIRTDDLVVRVEAPTIYYENYTDYSYAFTNIFALDIQDSGKPLTHQTFLLGAASTLYVSPNNMYITTPWYNETATTYIEGTKVHKIRVDNGDISYVADGVVPGWVLNQFSMDEQNGYFRIATTVGHAWEGSSSKSNVYVLNTSLGVVGGLEGLAPGEQIYSARFMGNRCYLVTFRKVDPLFAIDLTDPANPKVLGKLKIPGYSDYLHPYDENHLIGIGKETADAEQGDFSWYQGVKIALFDVTDVTNPRELAKFEIGDRGTDSPVLRDHKAFLFSRSKGLLVMPVLVAEIDPKQYSGTVPPDAYGEYVYQGAYVFNVTLTEGIQLKGRITHMEGVDDLMKSGWYFESPYAVKRSLYIDDALYTISDKMIKINSLDTLNEIKTVELP